MSARALLHRLVEAGVELRTVGDRLRYRGPAHALTREVVTELRHRKVELLKLLSATTYRALRPGRDGSAAELIERFLTDAEIPLALFQSRTLGRDFVLARSREAIGFLSSAERSLPVLFMTDIAHAATIGIEGLRALLEARAAFGPEVALLAVRPGRAGK